MDIKKLHTKKDELEDEIYTIKHQVKERWKKLIGFGCGYMGKWCLIDGMVIVNFESHGNCNTDKIPLRFFEIEDHDLATKKFKEYQKEILKAEKIKELEDKEKEERKLFDRLKKKYKWGGA